jgi:hypothetical protein
MVKAHQTIRPGISIVFEGLDRTGKSTQLDMLRDALDPTSVVFAHMPVVIVWTTWKHRRRPQPGVAARGLFRLGRTEARVRRRARARVQC